MASRDSQDLLTVHEAASLLGVADPTARRYADRSVLPSVRDGNGYRRFRREDVLKLASERKARQEAARQFAAAR